jgi:hypothetical protein
MPAQQAIVNQEHERINRLHCLAVRCADAVLHLHYLRSMADGDRHARAVLIELQQLVAVLPELPRSNDPFCGETAVEVAGGTTTSWHTAAFSLARHTWHSAHITSLEDGGQRKSQDEKGWPTTWVSFRNVQQAPTEVEWSIEVWNGIIARLSGYQAPDWDKLAVGLDLEMNRATRRLQDRLGEVQRVAPAGDRAQESPGPRLKKPAEDAFKVFRYQLLTGKNQMELAKDTKLMELLGRPVNQGTISRWLTAVNKWMEAGNVLPNLPEPLGSKPTPMDPERIDLGKRQDNKAKRQRQSRNSDDGD